MPYTESMLNATTSRIIHRSTRTHSHPHPIRTVRATQEINKTPGDFSAAMIMRNDRMATVIAQDTHLLGKHVPEKASRLIEERNIQGKQYPRSPLISSLPRTDSVQRGQEKETTRDPI
jgi:hypothetical protein